jgi:hypothetical protein
MLMDTRSWKALSSREAPSLLSMTCVRLEYSTNRTNSHPGGSNLLSASLDPVIEIYLIPGLGKNSTCFLSGELDSNLQGPPTQTELAMRLVVHMGPVKGTFWPSQQMPGRCAPETRESASSSRLL